MCKLSVDRCVFISYPIHPVLPEGPGVAHNKLKEDGAWLADSCKGVLICFLVPKVQLCIFHSWCTFGFLWFPLPDGFLWPKTGNTMQYNQCRIRLGVRGTRLIIGWWVCCWIMVDWARWEIVWHLSKIKSCIVHKRPQNDSIPVLLHYQMESETRGLEAGKTKMTCLNLHRPIRAKNAESHE